MHALFYPGIDNSMNLLWFIRNECNELKEVESKLIDKEVSAAREEQIRELNQRRQKALEGMPAFLKMAKIVDYINSGFLCVYREKILRYIVGKGSSKENPPWGDW